MTRRYWRSLLRGYERKEGRDEFPSRLFLVAGKGFAPPNRNLGMSLVRSSIGILRLEDASSILVLEDGLWADKSTRREEALPNLNLEICFSSKLELEPNRVPK